MSEQVEPTPQQITHIVEFIGKTFQQAGKTKAVIAVSGGIDSAVALTLLTQALEVYNVIPILLPYGEQDMNDARLVCDWLGFAPGQITIIDIKPAVDRIGTDLNLDPFKPADAKRLGNIMARVRMTYLFDLAASQEALVCGTENKSEHYLGYFTRFGDAASDLEPLANLYKTQVRHMARLLKVPNQLILKPPSAGLWPEQTDETELGFSYEAADQVLSAVIDQKIPPQQLNLPTIDQPTIKAIINRVEAVKFKSEVPYLPS